MPDLSPRQERIAIGISAILLFLVSSRHLFSVQMPSILDDEFGYWSYAAYLGGDNWSGIVSSIPYYTYGYGVLLAPLYSLIEDPTWMYRAAVAMNSVFVCLSFLVCYQVAKTLAPFAEKTFILGISILLAFYPSQLAYATIAWGECFLWLCFWVLAWFMLRLEIQPRLIDCILVGLIPVVMFTVHQRAIGILFAALAAITYLYFIKSIGRRLYWSAVLVMVLALCTSLIIGDYLQNQPWLSSVGNQGNSPSSHMLKLDLLFSAQGLGLFVRELAGQIFYLGIATFSLFFLGIFSLSKSIVKKSRPNNNAGDSISRDALPYKSLALFLLLSALATIAISTTFMMDASRIDQLVYGRYNDMIVGPVMLIALLRLRRAKSFSGTQAIIAILAIAALTAAIVLIVRASMLESWFPQNCTALALIPGFPYGFIVPAVVASIGILITYLTFRRNQLKAVAFLLWLMMLGSSFLITGEIALQSAIQIEPWEKEVIKIAKTLEAKGKPTELYFLWEPQSTDGEGARELWQSPDRYPLELIQFLLKGTKIYQVGYGDLQRIELKDALILVTPGTDREVLEDNAVFVYDGQFVDVLEYRRSGS